MYSVRDKIKRDKNKRIIQGTKLREIIGVRKQEGQKPKGQMKRKLCEKHE